MKVKDVVTNMYKIKETIDAGKNPPPCKGAEHILNLYEDITPAETETLETLEHIDLKLEPVNLKIDSVHLELEPVNLKLELCKEAKDYNKELTKLTKFLNNNKKLLNLDYAELLKTDKPTTKEKKLIILLSKVTQARYIYDIRNTPLKNIYD